MVQIEAVPMGSGDCIDELLNYSVVASTVLATTTVRLGDKGDGVRYASGRTIKPKHDAAYWDAVTAGFNFEEADQVPPSQFNPCSGKG